jgi:ribosomal protein L16 Arg81 hydroxylase
LDHKLVCDRNSAPTIVLHNDFYPGSIQSAYDEVKEKKDIKILHIYTSFGRNSLTFGRHCDTVDVLLVQSIGKMTYIFDDESKVELNPGDSLLIPKGVYHNPIVSQPRVTLSFSWE